MTDDFPAELKPFIAQHVESLAQLEAMLTMKRDAGREWTVANLAQSLYISDEMCGNIVADLERRGFVARSGDSDRFRYACADPALHHLLGQLDDLYRERRVAVITQIYSNPVKKVQTFADAFRLRREE